jgi:hypothetical protein
MSERENIRDTLLRAWLPFQWARRDYNKLIEARHYKSQQAVALHEKMMQEWKAWHAVLYEQFGLSPMVEYYEEHAQGLDLADIGVLVSRVERALVMGIIHLD